MGESKAAPIAVGAEGGERLSVVGGDGEIKGRGGAVWAEAFSAGLPGLMTFTKLKNQDEGYAFIAL